jgi:formylglycine-generating enzyme required for sulfatase activity
MFPRVPALLVLLLLPGGCFDLSRTWDGGAVDSKSSDVAVTDHLGGDGPTADRGGPEVRPPDLPPKDTAADGPPNVTPGWITVPAFTFKMGSPDKEECRHEDAEVGHTVELTRAFEIQNVEVTQAQYTALTGKTPPFSHTCPDCPAEHVTWHQAAEYCNKLSQKAGLGTCYDCKMVGPPPLAHIECAVQANLKGGKIYTCQGYRLPTEAEWERAYRAGTTTALYNGDLKKHECIAAAKVGDIAWYKANSSGKTHPGGQKLPNALKLYDMAGNVAEWCQDAWKQDLGSDPEIDPISDWDSATRVVRNGSFADDAGKLRAARRFGLSVSSAVPTVGFRCVRTK